MTKKELLEILQDSDLPDEAPIILSRDSEGNGFQELRDIEESTWSPQNGETYIKGPLNSELLRQGYSEEDLYDGGDAQDCLTLWP